MSTSEVKNSSSLQDSMLNNQEQTETTGQLLKRLRIEKGWSVDEVSAATKISIGSIKAFEEQKYEQLPSETFCRGLLSLYAGHLGLNGAETAALFFEERDLQLGKGKRYRGKETRILKPKRLAEPTHISSAAIASGIFFLIAVLIAVFCYYISFNPLKLFIKDKHQPAASLLEQSQGENTPGATTQEPAENGMNSGSVVAGSPPQPASEVGKALYSLEALFLKDCVVESAKDDGQVERKTYAKGERQTWSARTSLRITFDQPESAELSLNGSPMAFPRKDNGRYTLLIPENILDQ